VKLRNTWVSAVLVMIITLWIGIATSAAPITTLNTLRGTFGSFQAQFVSFDQDLLDFNTQLRSIVAEILNARDLIDAGNGHLDRLVKNSIEQAIDIKQISLDENVTQLKGDLEKLIETLNIMIGQLNSLCPPISTVINGDKCALVLIKLNAIGDYLLFALDGVDEVFALLEDGDTGENPTNPDTFDDVDDWLEFCLDTQIPGDDLGGCNQSLGQAYSLMQEIHSQIAFLFRKKKYIAKNFWNAQKLLLSTGAPRVRRYSALESQSSQTQVFTMTGALVYHSENRRQSLETTLESLHSELANGMYLAVSVVRDRDGTILKRDVNKLMIRR